MRKVLYVSDCDNSIFMLHLEFANGNLIN